MGFGGLVLTNGGRNELARTETGERFEITHIVLGEGVYGGSVTGIQSVVSPVMELPVSKIERNGSEVVLECDYNSTDVPRPFYFREIGVVANGVLCFYDNSRDDAEYIDPDSGVVVKQKRVRLVLLISSEVNITATIAGNLYALDEDLERHAGNGDIHVASEDKERWDKVSDKVDKEKGKGLSTNDYTNEDKDKLGDIEEGAQKNVQADWDETDEKSDRHIKNKPTIPSKASDVGAVPVNDLTTSYMYSGNMASAGWYRIAVYHEDGSVPVSQGSLSPSCGISLKRLYNNNRGEYHKVELRALYQQSSFREVSGYSNVQLLTKIRHVWDNNDKSMYIEVYYAGTKQNQISITIEDNKTSYIRHWTAITPIPTSESVEGVTVYASLDLKANTKGSVSEADHAVGADNSNSLKSVGSSVNLMPADGHMAYAYAINGSNAGVLPYGSNANAVMTVSRHPGKYYAQFGFSSNNNLYYRSTSNHDLDNNIPWRKVLMEGDAGGVKVTYIFEGDLMIWTEEEYRISLDIRNYDFLILCYEDMITRTIKNRIFYVANQGDYPLDEDIFIITRYDSETSGIKYDNLHVWSESAGLVFQKLGYSKAIKLESEVRVTNSSKNIYIKQVIGLKFSRISS